jgi:hypothetical protein
LLKAVKICRHRIHLEVKAPVEVEIKKKLHVCK